MEVVRVGGGLEDNMAGGDETDNNQDTEVQDRKLVCMVRQLSLLLRSGTVSCLIVQGAFSAFLFEFSVHSQLLIN